MTEPKGPVYVCLDTDVQEAKITTPMIVPDARLFRPPGAPGPNPEDLNRAAQLLAGADWPLIVAGELGKNPKALPSLLDLAELLGAPCDVIEGSSLELDSSFVTRSQGAFL